MKIKIIKENFDRAMQNLSEGINPDDLTGDQEMDIDEQGYSMGYYRHYDSIIEFMKNLAEQTKIVDDFPGNDEILNMVVAGMISGFLNRYADDNGLMASIVPVPRK